MSEKLEQNITVVDARSDDLKRIAFLEQEMRHLKDTLRNQININSRIEQALTRTADTFVAVAKTIDALEQRVKSLEQHAHYHAQEKKETAGI